MPRKTWAVAGIATAVVGGAVAYWINEKNVEQPDYRTVRQEGEFELREYPGLLAASVTMAGSREAALNRGFRRLADYIFAKDRGGETVPMTAPVMQEADEKIAMTAPVLLDGDSASQSWRVRFVMPSDYTRETLPAAPVGVEIEDIPARRMAAIRFSGRVDDARLRFREDRLRRWLEREGLQPVGNFEYAFYNSPFIPPFLRRNEVLVPVA